MKPKRRNRGTDRTRGKPDFDYSEPASDKEAAEQAISEDWTCEYPLGLPANLMEGDDMMTTKDETEFDPAGVDYEDALAHCVYVKVRGEANTREEIRLSLQKEYGLDAAKAFWTDIANALDDMGL